MNSINFTYKNPNFSSKILANGIVLCKTKYFIGEVEVNVEVVYCNGKVHHVYNNESIRVIDVKTPIN